MDVAGLLSRFGICHSPGCSLFFSILQSAAALLLRGETTPKAELPPAVSKKVFLVLALESPPLGVRLNSTESSRLRGLCIVEQVQKTRNQVGKWPVRSMNLRQRCDMQTVLNNICDCSVKVSEKITPAPNRACVYIKLSNEYTGGYRARN